MAEMPGIRMGTVKRCEVVKPLHRQRLEAALSIKPMLNQMEKMMAGQESDSEADSDDSDSPYNMSNSQGIGLNRDEVRNSRLALYNLSCVGPERQWLKEALLSSTSGSDSDSDGNSDDAPVTEEYLKRMLKEHMLHKKYAAKYYRNPERARYMYYGSGLLSTVDRFVESNVRRGPPGSAPTTMQVSHPGRPSRRGRGAPRGRRPKLQQRNMAEGDDFDAADPDQLNVLKDFNDDDLNDKQLDPKYAAKALRRAEQLVARRRRAWTVMAKKEAGRLQRSRAQQHRDQVQHCKRLATLCCRQARHKAMQSQKNMKETIWRCKRLTREMQAYWKRYDRAERETRRRMEREAEEQRKMDVELMEAKRQRRKLNFLITQTELYAHFMQRKLGGQDLSADHILRHLDEERDPRLATMDHYDSEMMKQRACHNAKAAFDAERTRSRRLAPLRAEGEDVEVNVETADEMAVEPETNVIGDHPQPEMFRGTLKGYQLKGMNWLANLYDQGISGILADEMGLGKTVQCIAFLCHVAERLGVWGPFLVVSPASTLHNWQQEMQRFAPDFNVVPYWGGPSERRILRQFWQRRDLHTRAAAFHVVVTSYQIVVSDLKYLNRVAWQHMILDEAQAIKSSASLRWKLLLGFSCRNRLLLSGTPIQNSMAELWALLHFIMPTLFDSHDEFNEWFSKDIESHAENKTAIDEKHLSRLHMILKPFMLRRIKKDVENELSDKIEIMVHCPLTIRQKLLYIALKKKIKIEDLLQHYCGGGGEDRNFTSNLMNLVMQFRKVCNHPELFERRDVKSPFYLSCDDYHVPRLVTDDCNISRIIPSKRHLLYNKFSIFARDHVHDSLFHSYEDTFSFTRLIDLSPSEVHGISTYQLVDSLEYLNEWHNYENKIRHRKIWWSEDSLYIFSHNVHTKHILKICHHGDSFPHRRTDSQVWTDLLFTYPNWTAGGVFFAHVNHVIHNKVTNDDPNDYFTQNCSEDLDKNSNDDVSTQNMHLTDSLKRKKSTVRLCQPTMMPFFLYCPMPKACSGVRPLYAASRAQAYRMYIPWTDTAVIPRQPCHGWAQLTLPDKNQLVTDAGKLSVLDTLLTKLKQRGHRVLIYSQMTKMIDILEEFMWYRKHTYMRLDGSSKISARRDMVADFQQRSDIFVFLLSTRAGGLGINLTAADTVIFYDSDWNPTVDQQAMDRAHRLGQTKQVTVYRLICKGTIEERIMQRAREKSEIQRMVISGGNFKPDTLKPKEVVSLLLDDEEIELKYNQRTEERRLFDQADKERKRRFPFAPKAAGPGAPEPKQPRADAAGSGASSADERSAPCSPQAPPRASVGANDDTSSEALVVDVDDVAAGAGAHISFLGAVSGRLSSSAAGTGASSAAAGGTPSAVMRRRGARRGRPRGSRRVPPAPVSTRQTYHSDKLSLDPSSLASMLDAPSLEPAAGAAHPQRGLPRRGPGRPRLRGGAAASAALRGGGSAARRPRRPRGPLLVPLGPQHQHHRQQ